MLTLKSFPTSCCQPAKRIRSSAEQGADTRHKRKAQSMLIADRNVQLDVLGKKACADIVYITRFAPTLHPPPLGGRKRRIV